MTWVMEQVNIGEVECLMSAQRTCIPESIEAHQLNFTALQ